MFQHTVMYGCTLRDMRTSINLPDGLLEAARERARRDGRTLTSLIEEGLRGVLARTQSSGEDLDLPRWGTGTGQVLVDLADRDALERALDDDRMPGLAAERAAGWDRNP
jgi:hypothetical protein